MKKILLGIAVVIIFAVYTLVQRHHSSDVATASTTDSAGQGAHTYKDGTYVGPVTNAFYGNLQVSATVSGGKIAAIKFLDTPHANQNSIEINDQAKPALQQEAIKAQSAHVDVVSGATQTSQAFVQSLSAALSKAT